MHTHTHRDTNRKRIRSHCLFRPTDEVTQKRDFSLSMSKQTGGGEECCTDTTLDPASFHPSLVLYTYTDVFMRWQVTANTHTHSQFHVHSLSLSQTYRRARAHAHSHTDSDTHTHTHTQTHAHTHKQTHAHTQKKKDKIALSFRSPTRWHTETRACTHTQFHSRSHSLSLSLSHTHTHTHRLADVHALTHRFTHTYTHMHKHMRTHTHTHTDTNRKRIRSHCLFRPTDEVTQKHVISPWARPSKQVAVRSVG